MLVYTILTEDRKDLQKYLQNKSISSDWYVRNDNYSVFKDFYPRDYSTDRADEFCSKHLNIPVGWWLTQEQREHIVNAINDY